MYWIIICIILLPLSIFGENITTKNGKVYKDVQIFKQESDRLMITYPGGAATIYLADCTEDIQRKYNYNAIGADTAKSEREKKAQATQEQLQRDQKIWVKNQNIQTEQADNDKVQTNNDDYKRKYTAAKIAYERFTKDYAPSYLKLSIYHLYIELIKYCANDKEFAFLVYGDIAYWLDNCRSLTLDIARGDRHLISEAHKYPEYMEMLLGIINDCNFTKEQKNNYALKCIDGYIYYRWEDGMRDNKYVEYLRSNHKDSAVKCLKSIMPKLKQESDVAGDDKTEIYNNAQELLGKLGN